MENDGTKICRLINQLNDESGNEKGTVTLEENVILLTG
jgi:hypothetical protein